jgi:hypothetical protein
MNDRTTEGRLIAHRRLLRLILHELAAMSDGERVGRSLQELSTFRGGQDDPGGVGADRSDIELAAAEEVRRILGDLPNRADNAPEPVRPAGPENVEEGHEQWDSVDEASDESFPASDPPPHP